MSFVFDHSEEDHENSSVYENVDNDIGSQQQAVLHVYQHRTDAKIYVIAVNAVAGETVLCYTADVQNVAENQCQVKTKT